MDDGIGPKTHYDYYLVRIYRRGGKAAHGEGDMAGTVEDANGVKHPFACSAELVEALLTKPSKEKAPKRRS